MPKVLESFAYISRDADLVLVEGAGSPAEVNLRAGDIANMGFAEAADLPVVLVGDIARGGVIASIVGTWMLLPPAERARLKGVIVNKFRGDVSLFDGGLEVIARETGLPCFGVVPHFAEARRLPAEDALAVESYAGPSRPPTLTLPLGGGGEQEGTSLTSPSPLTGEGRGGGEPAPPARDRVIRIAVPVISRIANFDDLDPLIGEPDVAVTFVRAGQAIAGDTDLVILPGSKATIADLAYLRAQGWDIDLAAHRRRGGWVLGLCAGYQMLGTSVRDPRGIEGAPGAAPGLGLLEVETELASEKTLAEAEGIEIASGMAVRGYEMHMGRTTGSACARPMLRLGGRSDGAVSPDGRVMGCYLHGLFAADGFRHAFLARIRARPSSGVAYEAEIEKVLDRLAAHLEAHLDLDGLLAAARGE